MAILNIVTHPHSAEMYAARLQAAHKLGKNIKIAGDLFAKLWSCYAPNQSDPTLGLTGEVFRFLNLDPSADWFDVQDGEPASERDLEQLRIPPHLKPHLQRIRYAFFPKRHRLVFAYSSRGSAMSPERVKRFFFDLLNDPAFVEQPPVEVTLVQDIEAVDRILALPMLRSLEVEVKRPNPDADDDEGEVMKELEKEKATKLTLILSTNKSESLEPDERTKRYARVAASNGHVIGKGKDFDEKPVTLETINAPLSRTVDVPADQAFLESFLEEARKMANNPNRE